MYANCRVDALDSHLISDAKMCAGFPPPQVALFSLFLEKGILHYVFRLILKKINRFIFS